MGARTRRRRSSRYPRRWRIRLGSSNGRAKRRLRTKTHRRRWCRCSRRGQGGSRFRQAQKGVGGKQPRRVIHLRPALLLPHMHLKAVIKQISRVASNMEQRRQRKRGEQCADASRRLQQLMCSVAAKCPRCSVSHSRAAVRARPVRPSYVHGHSKTQTSCAPGPARADLVRDTVTVSRFGSSARPAARTRRCGSRVQAMHTLER